MSAPARQDRGDDSISSDNSDDESCADSVTRGAFEAWWEDEANVKPDQKMAYLIMMMTTIDDRFSYDTILVNLPRKKEGKPTISMYKQELKRRDTNRTFGQVSNKKLEQLLAILRGPLKLTDTTDELFVRRKVLDFTNAIMNAVAEKAVAGGGSRSLTRKNDRIRFVECMALDHIKPLYLKVNEVFRRHELDGRNSDNIPKDFYDVVVEQFNNAAFTPYSRLLPDLHNDFEARFLLPFDDYVMTPARAKHLIASMKPRIAKIKGNYELSGNGNGMRGDDADDNAGNFNMDNLIEGDERKNFLASGDSSDLLYWWHVLEEEGMLNYTLSVFPLSIGATSESVPSVLTTTPTEKGEVVQNSMIDQLDSMKIMWENDNVLKKEMLEVKKTTNEMKRQRMAFEEGSFEKKMALDTMVQSRAFEVEIEQMEDQMEDLPDTEINKKRRIEKRIAALNEKIKALHEL
jgi:hypothetical protein